MPTVEDLHQAVRLHDVPSVKKICTAGVNVDLALRATTALSLAIYESQEKIIDILLENGADVNKLSTDYNSRVETPLFTACRLKKADMVKKLIDNGADPNITDFYNHSPLWISTRERRLDLVELLIKSGANLNLAAKWSMCPLYLATKLGRSDIAKILIYHGCSVNLFDSDGNGALYWAICNGDMGLIKMLINAGANLSYEIKEIASKFQDVEFCKWFIYELKTPAPLQRLCRTVIRQQLTVSNNGSTIVNVVNILNIPKRLKEYLLFQDCYIEYSQ